MSDQKCDPERELTSTFGVRSVRLFGFLLFTLAMTVLLVKLGMWQISRAAEKEDLLVQLNERQQQIIYQLTDLPIDGKGYGIEVSGSFDAASSILLDNQTYQGRVGYRWIMPFLTDDKWLLVELGWIPGPATRDKLPILPDVTGKFQVTGVVDVPSKRLVLEYKTEAISWPWRVQSVDIKAIAKASGKHVLPWIVRADTVTNNAGDNFDIVWGVIPTWQPVVMKPEKHYAYAVQWFGLALVLLIGFLVWWKKGRV